MEKKKPVKIFLELSIIVVVVAQKKIPTGKKLMNEKKRNRSGQAQSPKHNILSKKNSI